MEGPVAENYKNKSKTVGSDSYPVRATVQSLVYDYLYGLSMFRRLVDTVNNCACFVFRPVPVVDQVPYWKINVVHSTQHVVESVVQWTVQSAEKAGHPPKVVVPLGVDQVELLLVSLATDALIIIGLYFFCERLRHRVVEAT